eukprot:591202_1
MTRFLQILSVTQSMSTSLQGKLSRSTPSNGDISLLFSSCISIHHSCTIYHQIAISSKLLPTNRKHNHYRAPSSTKCTSTKTSHSFSPRRIVKHQILQRLLTLFVCNATATATRQNNNILIIHPYTGHFTNYDESRVSEGSSKVIIDTLLNLLKPFKMALSNTHIHVVFIEIFQNQLFEQTVRYLREHVHLIDGLTISIYVCNSSVQQFFGFNKNTTNCNPDALYHKLIQTTQCRSVFWFIDPYKVEVLLSPKQFNLLRLVSDNTVIHYIYFLLFVHNLKGKDMCNDKQNGLFHVRDNYLKKYCEYFDAFSIRIINNGTPNYDLVYLVNAKAIEMSHQNDIFNVFLKYNCHQIDKKYWFHNAFSEKYFTNHWNSCCDRFALMDVICNGIYQRFKECNGDNNIICLKDVTYFVQLCKYIWMMCGN